MFNSPNVDQGTELLFEGENEMKNSVNFTCFPITSDDFRKKECDFFCLFGMEKTHVFSFNLNS